MAGPSQSGEGMALPGDARFMEEGEASGKALIANGLVKLRKHVHLERQAYVKEKIDANSQKLRRISHQLFECSENRAMINGAQSEKDMLQIRLQKALSKFGADPDQEGDSPDDSSGPIVVGSTSGSRSVVKPVRLQAAQRIPPYTTWIFLDRNQRMADDQSVVGRRRIYYDTAGNEALICSDSEEEQVDEEEEKREFSKGDDYVIRTAAQECGPSKTLWKILADNLDAKAYEVEARFLTLVREAERGGLADPPKVEEEMFQDLSSAMDSFDNLFCRRCLVFDCRLHGCSQPVVVPCEAQAPVNSTGQLPKTPCGPCCFHLPRLSCQGSLMKSVANEDTKEANDPGSVLHTVEIAVKKVDRNPSELSKRSSIDKRVNALRKLLKRKSGKAADGSTDSRKKQRTDASAENTEKPVNENTPQHGTSTLKQIFAKKLVKMRMTNQVSKIKRQPQSSPPKGKEVKEMPKARGKQPVAADVSLGSNWNDLEKGLYEKGIQIFGRDSCRLAKNFLKGLKSCAEVGEFMQLDTWRLNEDGHLQADANMELDGEIRSRRFYGKRRGRVRKLKYTWKSVAPSLRKRLDGKEGGRQYTPCSCGSVCGKQCTCIRNGTCCEKYCGCSKACKNRFRGCHCAKSQCSSRQCPCFAAGRECDPDVCRNCCIGCGDGTLGHPQSRGDSYECRNMKLLLKQQQRVLLGRSDVAGWGAFLKSPVNKHDYLGEYTGELISHREADKRGKIYDRENSSFLFNLNDQYVLDACRKGDKLKFANHSPTPNCYAKVILVAGDHRVGIFAKERIAAGEELFYDYRYEADRAPAWARKPEEGHKHDETAGGSGRAQKTA